MARPRECCPGDNQSTAGSALGPVLLNIFINDPEQVMEHALVEFADDISLGT